MSESQIDLSTENRPNIFRRLWQKLVEPHSSLTDVMARRQAQLLAALSLALGLFFSFGAITSVVVQGGATFLIYGAFALIGVYLLSRTRYYRAGSILIVLLIIGMAYFNIYRGTDDPAGTIFAFMPFAFILGSVLLPLPGMIAVVVGTTIINFLLPVMNPAMGMRDIASAAGSLMAQGALFIVVIYFRNSVERLRLLELSNANEELQRASIEVQQSTQRVRAMFAALPDGIGVTNLSGSFLEANQSMANLAGLDDPDKLVGRDATEFVAPSDQERAAQDFTSGASVEHAIEYRMLSADGHTFDGELTAATLIDEQDQPSGFVIVARDITIQKQAQTLLKESEERYQAIFNASPVMFWLKDDKNTTLQINRAAAEFEGVEPEEIEGHSCYDIYPQEQAEAFYQDDLEVIQSGQPKLGILEQHTSPGTGETIWLETGKVPIYNEKGEVTGVLALAIDITVQKQSEQTLKESQRLLNSFIENFPDGVWAKDTEGRFMLANRYVIEEIAGSEVIGKTVYDTMPKENADFVWTSEKRVLETGESISVEEDVPHADGKIHKKITTKFPLYDAEGNISGVGGVLLDITESKNLEAQIQEAYERRGNQVQINTDISQEIAEASELSELFDQVVDLTKERLGYYHTQLLRYEPTQDAIILISGYGETGQKMVAEGHRMPMGSGLIGSAAATGETVMRSDLSEDPDWKPHPLLPDTRGEITVPIKLGDQVLGVLDVQSDQVGALTDDDRLMLEGLCGQIAIAIEQTRLRQEMAERLDEINRLYRTMNRDGWQAYQTSATLPGGFEYDQVNLRPVDADASTQSMFEMPLAIPGGAVIGNLAIDDSPENPLTPEDQAFLQQISEQVALALDSARLFDQAQTRSEELDILNEMGRTLTSLQDEQAIYETIYEYTGKLMDVSSFHIALYHKEEQEYSLPVMTEQGQRIQMPNQPAANGLTDYIIKIRQPLLFSTDVDAQARELGIEPIIVGEDLPTQSWLGVPLIFQDRVLGVVAVQSDTTPGLYTEHDRDLLTTIASQAAITLENATVFHQTQQQAEYEAMINQISQRIQSTTSVENALQVTIRELGKALGAKRTNVQLGLSKDK